MVDGHSGDDGRIVGEAPVTVDFREVLEKPFDIIQGIGAQLVARQQRSLLGGALHCPCAAVPLRRAVARFRLSDSLASIYPAVSPRRIH